jgi:uncharacterized MAPEG superfamily protein
MDTAMNIPLLSLLGFTLWTIILLLATVGVYRWRRIIAGTVPIGRFVSGDDLGDEWYGRAMRAHANCIENLPVFIALIVAAGWENMSSPLFDWMAALILAARIAQSLIHVCFIQTNRVASFRFLFYLIQVLTFLAMTGLLVHGLWRWPMS